MAKHLLPFSVAIVCLALLSSCGAPGQGSGTGDLQVDLSDALAPYQVLNLTTGAMAGRVAVPDLGTNDDYRGNLMVFRLVESGATTVGTAAGSFGAGVDQAATSVSVPAFYCGVFEVTQAQWQLLAAGGTPWTTVTTVQANALGSTTTSAKRPAFGLSKDLLTTTLSTFNAGKAHQLAIPSNAQWERACRAGGSAVFSWGSNPNDRTAASSYAVVQETAAGQNGARQVGERLPNAFGLYDMHGNVWELTQEGLTTSIRGGSWRDPLSLSRSAYRVVIDQTTPHGLVGTRLVLIP